MTGIDTSRVLQHPLTDEEWEARKTEICPLKDHPCSCKTTCIERHIDRLLIERRRVREACMKTLEECFERVKTIIDFPRAKGLVEESLPWIDAERDTWDMFERFMEKKPKWTKKGNRHLLEERPKGRKKDGRHPKMVRRHAERFARLNETAGDTRALARKICKELHGEGVETDSDFEAVYKDLLELKELRRKYAEKLQTLIEKDSDALGLTKRIFIPC